MEFENPIIQIIVPIVLIYLTESLTSRRANDQRAKLALHQGEIYHKRLRSDFDKMEEEKLSSELESAEEIEKIEKQLNELKEGHDKFGNDSDGWNSDSSMDEESENSINDKELKAKQELTNLKTKQDELDSVEKDFQKVAESLSNFDLDGSIVQQAKEQSVDFEEKINKLKIENDELKTQIELHKSSKLSAIKAKLDPELISFLEEHTDELTLSFLKNAYETLLDLRATNPKMDFNQYIKELKDSRENYITELTELHVSKKEIEHKLRCMKERYEEELSSFNETKIEQLCRKAGVDEYLSGLKRKNEITEQTIVNLQKDLESKRKEVEIWKDKYKEAEDQYNKYFEAYKDITAKRDQMEYQRRAAMDREKRLGPKMNLSSASSLVDASVPPPPPIDVPPVDQILREAINDNSDCWNV